MAVRRKGQLRQRGRSIEVRVYAGNGRVATRTITWQGDERTTLRLAEKELARLTDEVEEHGHRATPQATFAALAEDWFATRARDWSPSTAAAHRHRLNRQILPALGGLRLRALNATRISDWLRDMGAAPATRYKCYLMVRSALDHGVQLGWVHTNAAARVRPPTVPPPTIDAPAPADVARLLEAAKAWDAEFHLYLYLAAVTGARRSELVGIQWRDFDGDSLLIRRAVVLGPDGRVHVKGYPKSKRPRRITLDPGTVELVEAQRARAHEVAAACATRVPASGFVFATEVDGSTPWRPDRATQSFGRLRARVGVEGVRLHDLRHFVATRLLDAGYAVADVAARLGHADAAVTHRIYAHAIPARDADLAATMAAIVGLKS